MNKEEIVKILAAIGVSGLVVAAIAAPGVLVGFSMLLSRKTRLSRIDAYRVLRYAKNSSWVKIVETAEGPAIMLTEKGVKRLHLVSLQRKLGQDQWDKKWRVVIFDIPDKKKIARDMLRRTLRQLGFVQLQESVWVSPYPCAREIEVAKQFYGLGDDLKLITATHIQGQDSLIQKFDLAPTAR